MKYRKKPVVVEARQITLSTLEDVAAWCKGSIKGIKLPRELQVIEIYTLEGEMRADIGDFVIKGVEGEFYPCKPGIFAKTYEAVE